MLYTIVIKTRYRDKNDKEVKELNSKLTDIINKGECITTEFKEAKTKLNRDVYESVCGFLNRLGGHLFLGVKDDATIVGVDRSCVERIKKDFVTSINNPQKLAPTIYVNVDEIEIDGKTVLHIYIPCSTQVHRTNGRIIDRNEDGDFDITDNTSAVAELYIRKNNISYTETQIFPFVSVEDLDKNTINRVRIMAKNQRGGEHPWEAMSDLELLKSSNLYGKDLHTGKEGINLAGILLLGTQQLILSALPHYKTDAIVRREDLDRYDDRIVVLDNLVIAYSKLMEFTEKHLNDTFYLEGTQRISIRNKIFREVCANLLIHREFSSAYPAKLIIEADRVRTENANKPHGFGLIDADNFSPYPKNPAISKFFREIGLADELGSGIRNINKYLKVYSGGKPEFYEDDIFKLTVPVKKYEKTDTTTDTHQDTTTVTTTVTDSNISKIQNFCQVPRSRQEIQEFIGLKNKSHVIKTYIKPMLSNGLIKMMTPDKPHSRNQKYVTANGDKTS